MYSFSSLSFSSTKKKLKNSCDLRPYWSVAIIENFCSPGFLNFPILIELSPALIFFLTMSFLPSILTVIVNVSDVSSSVYSLW